MVATNFNYTMNESSRVAKQAATDIEAWLRSKPATIDVFNVEDDPEFRQKDIDLLYKYFAKDNSVAVTTIEIKGDRWHKTGNYFFETISNEQKQTPGCFMYSEAEFLFYYFIETKELHIIPLKPAREWFIKNIDSFTEKKTMTPLRNGDHYNTVGRLVPIKLLLTSVANVRVKNL